MISPKTYQASLFSSRPVREHACSACRGSGSVTEPYALAWCEFPFRWTPDGAIPAIVVGSSSIFEATREAAEIAGRAGQTVAFEFIGGRIVSVSPGQDPDMVARTWWISEYGKTPEESMADR